MAYRKTTKKEWTLARAGAWASIVGIPIAVFLWYLGASRLAQSPKPTLSTTGSNSPVLQAGRDAVVSNKLPGTAQEPLSTPDEVIESAPLPQRAGTQIKTEGMHSPVLSAGRDAILIVPSSSDDSLTDKFSDTENVALAVKYWKGDGVSVNYTLARQHAEAAVKQGNSEAVYLMALWYDRGDVYDEDYKTAERLFVESFRMGNADAAFYLAQKYHRIIVSMRGPGGGLMYAAHYGLHKPLHWYIQAHRAGHEKALQELKDYDWSDITLKMLKKDYPEVYQYFEENLIKEIRIVRIVPAGNGL